MATARNPDDEPVAPLIATPAWAVSALGHLTDLVVVLDDSLTLLWANGYTKRLLGYRDEDEDRLIGTSIAEFVHPDDLLRAGEVVGMMVEDQLVVPVTPALYRLRQADGAWTPVELNGVVVPASDGLGALIVIVGRYSGDRHLQDHILEMLTSGASTDDVVELIPGFGHWRHPYEVYAIWYRNARGEWTMAGTELAAELAAVAVSGNPWQMAVEHNEEVVAEADDLPPAVRALAEQHMLGACWAIPVPDPLHDEHAAVIAWSRAGMGIATPVHRYALETMARSLELVLQWRRQRTGLEDAARCDSLTGVANRGRVFEVLGELRREAAADGTKMRVGLLYVDLDGFKDVNDLHGHTAGDAVLTEVARRISTTLRPGDMLGRLGGDEFAVVCRDVPDDSALPSIAQRIIEAVSPPMRVGRAEIAVGASIGVAMAVAAELRPDELIDRADNALYSAKAAGRGRWHAAPAAT
ncbi:MAG: GGDEF domain-containing protein [Actinobacteria bacterium]|nr:GGDEF domain-containing protein [Actinomycetota bacterium]